jgi:menaquinone-9 beta-reductase
MKHVDVAIIGGSLAGAACVRELQRMGIDAVAFERDRFPRDKVCGGFLSPGAVDLVDQLGILGEVRAAGAKPVRSTRVRMRGFETCVALPREGLGISRRTLDSLLADHPGVQQGAVRDVQRTGDGFRVQADEADISARVVIDAAGKLSRFTRRRTTPQFGVQFYESQSREDVLDFWFFGEGYGGAVSVEGNRSNACFLIYKDALPRYLRDQPQVCVSPSSAEEGWTRPEKKYREASSEGADGVVSVQKIPDRTTPSARAEVASRLFLTAHPPLLSRGGDDAHLQWENHSPNVLVTGPLSYERLPSDYLSIGDASGMVDPFCGEGMRHALDTGMCAAKLVAEGLRRQDSYDTIRRRYEQETLRRWGRKRRLGRFFRMMLQHPRLSAAGFRMNPEYWLRKLWD